MNTVNAENKDSNNVARMALRGASGGHGRGVRGPSPVTTGARNPVPEKCHSATNVRGYTKIASAARAFNFDFKNKTILDIGSSTGGFTEYALKQGAKKVIAVEKGTNQMKSPLRFDPRVELHEKTDVFRTRIMLSGNRLRRREQSTSVPEKCHFAIPDIIMADVSFISLTKILAYAKMNLSRPSTEFLVMFKPQFEAAPNDLHKGVVKNETIRRRLIKNFELWLKQNGFLIVNKHDNDLKGKTGNRERFYYLRLAK